MKVHRIITTIEVENDNSITSVELTKLSLDNIKLPLVITNITTNGSANDIKQIYDSVDKRRLDIAIKLKSIVRYINESLDNHERDELSEFFQTSAQKIDGAFVFQIFLFIEGFFDLAQQKFIAWKDDGIDAGCIENLAQVQLGTGGALIIVGSSNDHDRFVFQWMDFEG